MRRYRGAQALYTTATISSSSLLLWMGANSRCAHPFDLLALVAVSTAGAFALHEVRLRTSHQFDMGIGLMLVTLVLVGPVAATVVGVVPDLIFLARRRQAPWRLWSLANLTSLTWAAIVAAIVLKLLPGSNLTLDATRLLIAGIAMVVVNYAFARFFLAVLREGLRPISLLRNELLRGAPVELAAVLIGVVSALLVPEVGVLALSGFAAIVYLPQWCASLLLRAPSVAGLHVDKAAAVYRDALAAEMRFSGSERRYTHVVDALSRRRPLPSKPANPLAAAKDALSVTLCTECPPREKRFRASPAAQVVIVAREWAQLTARCTPALSHREAMVELRRGALAREAPLALIAAARIVEREHALSTHIAAAPRLHRAPLPRALRRGILPLALSRMVS